MYYMYPLRYMYRATGQLQINDYQKLTYNHNKSVIITEHTVSMLQCMVCSPIRLLHSRHPITRVMRKN